MQEVLVMEWMLIASLVANEGELADAQKNMSKINDAIQAQLLTR